MNTVRLFWADGSGWHQQDCRDIEDAAAFLGTIKRQFPSTTHWAVAPLDKCDGGATPPPAARIHDVASKGYLAQEFAAAERQLAEVERLHLELEIGALNTKPRGQ